MARKLIIQITITIAIAIETITITFTILLLILVIIVITIIIIIIIIVIIIIFSLQALCWRAQIKKKIIIITIISLYWRPFDDTLRRGLSLVLNVELSDKQRSQANLPVQMGSLGVRSAYMLASSASLASAATTLPLQNAIISESIKARRTQQ